MSDRAHKIQFALGLIGCLAVLAVWVWIEQKPIERVSPPPGKALAIDKSPAAQDERKVLIDRLIAEGLVREVETKRAGAVRVSVRPAFYLLDAKARIEHLNAIYAYYYDGSSTTDTLTLRDARHGNNVGRYNPYTDGLVMYK